MRFANILALSLFLVPAVASAEKYSFDVDPKLVNISFESRMEIEDILGTTHKATGSAQLEGKTASFDISVPVDSLRTGIDLRDEHLKNDQWLNAKKHPNITFKGDKIRKAGKDKYKVSGQFEMNGVARPKTVTVDVRRIPEATAKKLGLGSGNWLRVRSDFKVDISEHDIKVPDMAAAKVAKTWTVRVSLFAKEVQ